MAASEMSGKVHTVLGPIDPEDLGITLPHEHLLGHFKSQWSNPADASSMGLATQPITLENLDWIRNNYPHHYDTLGLYDEELVIKELSIYYRAGGQSVVEASTRGLGRDPLGLARVSRATGVNIITGAGYYLQRSQPLEWKQMSEDAMTEQIIKDVLEGIDDTGIKAGIIGEVACSPTPFEAELRSLRAGARAQGETGAALLIHPGTRDPDSLLKMIEIIAESGGDLRRTVMGHLDRVDPNVKTLKRMCESGCYVEYDKFGQEGSSQSAQKGTMPNDATRLDYIIQLIEAGHLDKILMSHDIAHKHQYSQLGGHGYVHMVKNVVPLMRAKGMTWEQIRAITVENPKQALTFS